MTEGRRWGRRALGVPSQDLAPALLGQVLIRVLPDGEQLAGRIVETEAYMGVADLAAHSAGGRRTARNEVMYGPPGLAYVYFTYGMHYCFNVVCGAEGEPVAVLIRALEPVGGVERMRAHRAARAGRTIDDRQIASGPARLCQALAIDRAQNGLDLVNSPEMSIERARLKPGERERIRNGPRIGIDYAGDWVAAPLRWWIEGNPNISRR